MKRTLVLGTWLVAALTVFGLAIAAGNITGNVAEAQDGMLAYGDSVFGVLEAAPRTYTFTGAENDQVSVDAFRMSDGLTVALTLRAPDGQELAQSVHDRLRPNGRNAHLAHVLPQNGTYTLEVRAEEGAGNFMLRLQGRAEPVALEMAYGVAVEVDVPQNAPPQFFTFEARTCATTLTVTNLSTGEPYTFPFAVTLRNEAGQAIARLRGGVAHEDRVTVAAESGTYEVEVRPADPTAEGRLSLLVSCASGAPGCGGSGEAGGDECPACPSCPEAWDGDGGVTPTVCENVHVTATLIPATSGAEVTWDAVPNAAYYWLHVYGYAAGDETYLGAIGVPGSDTSLTFDHLFPGLWGFRFVVEAVGADDSTLCVGEDAFTLADEETSCEAFAVTGEVLSNADRTATWSWTGWPDAAFYVGVLSYDDAGGVRTWYDTSAYDAATTSLTTTHPPAAETGNTWTLLVGAMSADGLVLCSDEATITFESGVEHVVPYVCDITLLSPREGMANGLQTFYWTPVEGATSYRVRVYNESGALVAEGVVDAPATSLTLDVSTGAIGGGFTFHVAVEALRYGEHWCVDAVTELRAAEDTGGGGDNSGGSSQCYYLTALADPSNAGYAAPLTAANCGNGYTAGTNVDVQAYLTSNNCWLDYWDGCGASGNANPVTITINSDCTITAYLQCIQ